MSLQALPARAIVRAIAHAAERWMDADFPVRVRTSQQIARRTGYSMPVVEFALDQLFGGVTEAALSAAIEDELGSVDVLDGFSRRTGRPATWARPIGKVCVIASRTTIGVALPPAIYALCAKCDVTVRDREDALCAEFFATLAAERSEFAQAARAATWGHNGETVDYSDFDAVVAFGHDDTLQRIRTGVRPGACFIGFGSRASAGYVTRETLTDAAAAREAARGAARDVVLYDTQGCLSLHVLFVERHQATESFRDELAAALEAMEIELPPGDHGVVMRAALAQAQAVGVFRRANQNDLFEAAPRFAPRMLDVIPVSEPRDAAAYIARHRIPLEAFAVSSVRDDLVSAACESGAVRIAKLGELQRPPIQGHHGGRPRIAEFVRWLDKAA